jgi:hypothetical protein
MTDFESCTFKSTTIILDGNAYDNCLFENCKIIVTQGNFSLRNTTFDGCNFEFSGEAENIKNLIVGLMGRKKRHTIS